MQGLWYLVSGEYKSPITPGYFLLSFASFLALLCVLCINAVIAGLRPAGLRRCKERSLLLLSHHSVGKEQT